MCKFKVEVKSCFLTSAEHWNKTELLECCVFFFFVIKLQKLSLCFRQFFLFCSILGCHGDRTSAKIQGNYGSITVITGCSRAILGRGHETAIYSIWREASARTLADLPLSPHFKRKNFNQITFYGDRSRVLSLRIATGLWLVEDRTPSPLHIPFLSRFPADLWACYGSLIWVRSQSSWLQHWDCSGCRDDPGGGWSTSARWQRVFLGLLSFSPRLNYGFQ